MYRVLMYRTRRGDRPVEEYLEQLQEKHRAKIAGSIQLLAREGPNLRRPYADTVDGPLRELRITLGRLEHRIFHYVVLGDAIVLLHAFNKKTQQLPRRELDLARSRMDDLNARISAGEVLE